MTKSESIAPSRWTGLLTHSVSLLAQGLLSVYRATASPLMGPCCRFVPSCSAYASEAVQHHGIARGAWMTLRRLLRCHPFHPGGWDPVR